ncbi:hypothetical protein BMF94_0837 [Rhodotorula taiwanensis]|uniref:Mitochondrial import inner membrane translocase subunit TIM21 n=1 Tax=Rhodotorula taiwanensis TaxID=741276 RepID=A0A2S5BH80_9BASI|nr:hypothetical protein BMF94_0837 [Rhodotorula taiwanensis]
MASLPRLVVRSFAPRRSTALVQPRPTVARPLQLHAVIRCYASTPTNDPHPILSELERQGATSPSSSSTSGPHLGPFPLPNHPAQSEQERQARIDASSRQWSRLGVAQKAGVVATQSASLVVVLGGAGLFALVVYAFTSELFSEASPTRVFEDCVERVKQDPELATMLAPPYSFHGPPTPADARLRRNRRPSHSLTVDPQTGLETLFVRFALTATDPSAASSGPSSPLELEWWTSFSWDGTVDWVKKWVGPLVWDDSAHPGRYDPRLSSGLTEAEEEARAERERHALAEAERRRKRGESWTGWIGNGVSRAVGGLIDGATGGLSGLRKSAAGAGAAGGAEGSPASYFRRPRKPAYGEYTTAEVIAELQKDPNTGHFVYKQLFAAIPDTHSSNYYRYDIPTAVVVPPEGGEQAQGQQRWRFWNRQKTVLT